MAFRWRCVGPAGAAVEGPDEEFDDRAQAEDWFATEWPELRARGVDAVTLMDGDTRVYGPMSLHET